MENLAMERTELKAMGIREHIWAGAKIFPSGLNKREIDRKYVSLKNIWEHYYGTHARPRDL